MFFSRKSLFAPGVSFSTGTGNDLKEFEEILGTEFGMRAAAAPTRFKGARVDGVDVPEVFGVVELTWICRGLID